MFRRRRAGQACQGFSSVQEVQIRYLVRYDLSDVRMHASVSLPGWQLVPAGAWWQR